MNVILIWERKRVITGKCTAVTVQTAEILTYSLLYLPSIKQVVERYTDLTGKSAMLPRYALGYLGSSMYYPELEKDCDDAILEFIDTTKEEAIPVDGFQLSSGYCAIETEEGIKRCVFTWNDKRFKDPKDFFKQMTDRGVCVSET